MMDDATKLLIQTHEQIAVIEAHRRLIAWLNNQPVIPAHVVSRIVRWTVQDVNDHAAPPRPMQLTG